MTKLCAICADGPGVMLRPLGRNDAMVPVCVACETGAIVAATPVDRAYEPSGYLTLAETIEGERRIYGAEEHARITEKASRDGQRPSAARPKALLDLDAVRHEGIRRRRARSDGNDGLRSSRDKKLY